MNNYNKKLMVHVFSTDPLALKLIEILPIRHNVVRIIVPENRLNSKKTIELIRQSKEIGINTGIHKKNFNVGFVEDKADIAISWVYTQLFSDIDISMYRLGVLNMHSAEIPKYRGGHTLAWALLNGEKKLGVTWHECNSYIDAGPIWGEDKVAIKEEWGRDKVRYNLLIASIDLFNDVWINYCNKSINPKIPDLSNSKLWKRRTREDSLITTKTDLETILRMIKFLTEPWPAPFIRKNDIEYIISGVSNKNTKNSIIHKLPNGDFVYLTTSGKSKNNGQKLSY